MWNTWGKYMLWVYILNKKFLSEDNGILIENIDIMWTKKKKSKWRVDKAVEGEALHCPKYLI